VIALFAAAFGCGLYVIVLAVADARWWQGLLRWEPWQTAIPQNLLTPSLAEW